MISVFSVVNRLNTISALSASLRASAVYLLCSPWRTWRFVFAFAFNCQLKTVNYFAATVAAANHSSTAANKLAS